MKASAADFMRGFVGGYAIQQLMLVVLVVMALRSACHGRHLAPFAFYGAAVALCGTLGLLLMLFAGIKFVARHPDHATLILVAEQAPPGFVGASEPDDPLDALPGMPVDLVSTYFTEFHNAVLLLITVYLASITFALVLGATLSLRQAMYDNGGRGWFGPSHDYYLNRSGGILPGGGAQPRRPRASRALSPSPASVSVSVSSMRSARRPAAAPVRFPAKKMPPSPPAAAQAAELPHSRSSTLRNAVIPAGGDPASSDDCEGERGSLGAGSVEPASVESATVGQRIIVTSAPADTPELLQSVHIVSDPAV